MNKMYNYFIKPSVSIKEAIKNLNKTGRKCLIVSDKNRILKGTLSDGDIRKAILNGYKIETEIHKIYNRKSKYLIDKNYNDKEIKRIFTKLHLDLIPIINKYGQVVKIHFWEEILKKSPIKKTNLPVLIMAGGIGSRLQPYTFIIPKPLIPINNKTIIERIIENFENYGCNKFFLTINYKSNIIKHFFEDYNSKSKFEFIVEKKPLGTVGGAKKIINRNFKNIIVSNCDIISKININELEDLHQKNNYDITIVASTKGHTIPYGVCEIDDNGILKVIKEKPHFDFLINIGIYILKKETLKLIPTNKFFDMTDLIQKAKNIGLKVGIFPIYDHDWLDVGQWSEYKKALDKI